MDAFGDRLRSLCVAGAAGGQGRAGQGESIAWSAPQREDLCLRQCFVMLLGSQGILSRHW